MESEGVDASLRAKRSNPVNGKEREWQGKHSIASSPLAGLLAMTNLIRRSPRGKRAADIENERTKRAGQQA
jgi:hypothetical protein